MNKQTYPGKTGLLLFFLATLMLFFKTAKAEEMIKKGDLLSLRRCIEIALKKHPAIQAAKDARMAAEGKLGQARSNYYPQIEIGTSYNRMHQRDTFDHYSGTLSIKQNIYDFGRTKTSIDLQKLNLESSEAGIEETRLAVIYDVTRAYYNLIKAKRKRDVALEIVRQFEEHLRQAKGFYDEGIRPRYDVTQAEVNLSNAKLGLIKAENTLRLAIISLNNSMGVPDAPEYDIEDDLNFKKYEITLDNALSFAFENRPDLKSMVSQRMVTEKLLELARKNYNPVLLGLANLGWTGNTFPLEREWNIGATLTIPIFNGFLTRYQVSEAEANLNTIKANEEALRQKIYMEVHQAYLNLREAEERIPTAELAVRQAIENLEIARGRYEASLGSPVEVTDAETSYANAQASYIEAITDYRIAIATLEKAIGKGGYNEETKEAYIRDR